MPAYGFDGTLDEVAEARRQLRISEIGYRHGVWSGGVASAGSGARGVAVSALDCIIAGVWSPDTNTVATTLNLTANGSTNPRIDYIVAEANWGSSTSTLGTPANSVAIAAIQGTAAAKPSPPALTQNGGVLWQMPLARVTVPGGAAIINNSNIETCRPMRRAVDRYTTGIPAQSGHGKATDWNTVAFHDITDPGWPYRMLVSATARFAQTESDGTVSVRVWDATDNNEYARGVTGPLRYGKSPANVTAETSPIVSGSRRVRLEMFANDDIAAGEVYQLLAAESNHFSVQIIPA